MKSGGIKAVRKILKRIRIQNIYIPYIGGVEEKEMM